MARRPPERGGPRRRRPHLDPPGAQRLLIDPSSSGLGGARGRAAFEAALAAPPAAGGRDADAGTLEQLAVAPVQRAGEVLYGSNAVFLLELAADDPSDPAQPMRAIYKPARGERALWDFPLRTLCLREVATYLVDAALGTDHVPPTVMRDGPLGPGSVQLYVHPVAATSDGDDADDVELQLREVAALDVLTNNADRKRAHLLVTEGPRIRAIDNALTFLPYPRQRTALISLGGTPLPLRTRRRLNRLARPGKLDQLVIRLRRMLADREVDAFAARVKELAADPVYPALDDWDGRPFEWW